MAASQWQNLRSATADTRPDPAVLLDGSIAINTATASPGVYFKAADGSLAKAGTAQVGATAPNATPNGFAGNAAGEFWFDTGVSELKLYDGTAWVSASASGYVLPAATTTTLGGVIVGSGLDVAADGTLSVAIEVVELLGSADPTAAAPAATVGNAYIANVTGVADASWTGIAGKDIAAGDILLYDGANWIHNQAQSISGVLSVTGVAPVLIGGTAKAPEISVAVATTTTTGVVSVGEGLAVDAAGVLSVGGTLDEGLYA